MKSVLVAMAHPLTEGQRAELEQRFDEIYFLKDVAPTLFESLSNCPGDRRQLHQLANDLHHVVYSYDAVVLPIGSPAFMWIFTSLVARCDTLHEAYHGGYQGADLKRCPQNFETLFAHSIRVSEEITGPDGSVKKISRFEHQGFF